MLSNLTCLNQGDKKKQNMSDMRDTMLTGSEGIKKTILHGGMGDLPKCITGTKVVFVLRTLLTLSEQSDAIVLYLVFLISMRIFNFDHRQ